ncbi:hemolysin family protein [Iodidimonas sp. SYSU 1G8]|uniref:hemolysin family protein n=1 Tax=Iodidimonas sp. SYSU 1G8 TaxID=3133967 RepID=UPI0031FF42B2
MNDTSTEDDSTASLKGWVSGMITRLRGREPSLRESLEDVIEEHRDDPSDLTAEERIMLMNIVSLRGLEVSDVMVPRADIVAVEMSLPLDGLVLAFKEAAHSRLPVYRDTLDDVAGMVHVKDLLSAYAESRDLPTQPSINDIKRRVLFVPPSMPVIDLLLKMRLSRIHMALVIDEYGGTDGLVTIEDLIETIVGDIDDEHDEQLTPLIMPRPSGLLDVDARCPIEDLEAQLGIDLLPEDQEDYIDTVGGLLFSLSGRVPLRGEVVEHPSGVEFEVVEADARQLKRVRVRKPRPELSGDTLP